MSQKIDNSKVMDVEDAIRMYYEKLPMPELYKMFNIQRKDFDRVRAEYKLTTRDRFFTEKDLYCDEEGVLRHICNNKPIKTTKDRDGYLRCTLNYKNVLVHRIIGKSYIPNPENKPTINHINGKKDDNRICNLEWATYSENERHSYDVLGKKANTGHLKKYQKGIGKMTFKPFISKETSKVYLTRKEYTDEIGISSTSFYKKGHKDKVTYITKEKYMELKNEEK